MNNHTALHSKVLIKKNRCFKVAFNIVLNANEDGHGTAGLAAS